MIGQQWDGDERIVLFVRLRDGAAADAGARGADPAAHPENTSPRHVPARILQVTDIPRTKSGKIVELAVRDVVHGREVRNREALANPDALDQFRNRPELNSWTVPSRPRPARFCISAVVPNVHGAILSL